MAPPTRLPSWKTPVCIEWNENLGAGSPRPFCMYEHICYCCVNVPGIPEKRHKAIYCLLAKLDVKSAFCLLPVHVADRHLLAMRWNNQIYFDTCLPFGLRSAPKLFNVLADLLSWILMQHGISPLVHYLDDFLTMGPADSTICHDNFSTIQRFYQELGIPLASDKLVGPSHSLTFLFLGIELDTVRMEARLPEDKLT